MLTQAILIEILVIILLIFLNGLFSMAEMALVSARKNRLQQKADGGDLGARKALELTANPTGFLSTVQIGITLIGILSGAVGGATLAGQIGLRLGQIHWLAPYSEGIGVAIVVLLITYFSLVLGELAPKRLALTNAEKVAAAVAPWMTVLAKLTAPVVSLVGGSTNLALRLLGVRASTEPDVTEDDVESMIAQGTVNGVFEENEQDMVKRIFRLGDRNVSAVMTPRPDVIFLNLDDTRAEILHKITLYLFSHFPVIQDDFDNVLGIVNSRDLLLHLFDREDFAISSVLQPALFIPENASALDALELLKTSASRLAIVIDEYGGLIGLVSMNDILEAIVGDILTPSGQEEAEAVQREDGSWLLDGMILVEELQDILELDQLLAEDAGNYETLGGLMMTRLGRIPTSGDYFDWNKLRFEVVDMDGRRVDKVLVSIIANG